MVQCSPSKHKATQLRFPLKSPTWMMIFRLMVIIFTEGNQSGLTSNTPNLLNAAQPLASHFLPRNQSLRCERPQYAQYLARQYRQRGPLGLTYLRGGAPNAPPPRENQPSRWMPESGAINRGASGMVSPSRFPAIGRSPQFSLPAKRCQIISARPPRSVPA